MNQPATPERYATNDLNTVKRLGKRAAYDRATVHAILDAGLVCHVSYVHDGQPVIIPTLHARIGEEIYVHGSQASRMLRALETGAPCCICVTHIDGIVLARSVFNHSINYRSAVVFGHGRAITGEAERYAALTAFTEKLMPGRWDDSRPPNREEMLQTGVVAVEIEGASAKVRTGPPGDDADDVALPHWAGVLPMHQAFGSPLPAPNLADGIALPGYLREFLARQF